METERGSIKSPSVENSFWKGLQTYRKTDYGMNEWTYAEMHIIAKLQCYPSSHVKITVIIIIIIIIILTAAV